MQSDPGLAVRLHVRTQPLALLKPNGRVCGQLHTLGLTGPIDSTRQRRLTSVPDIGTHKKHEFWMPPHTRVCVTATGAVLLDLKRNRYFGLGYREARSLSTLATNWSSASTSAAGPLEPMPQHLVISAK